jgi:hydrocephalus-inducing protein
MRLLFTSKYEGQFDQTLNFEIQGTRRRYQLFCRGLCQLPTISKEPRIVFPNRKRAVKKGEIISKKYLLDQDEFQFGPLHCGKPRERYREGRYPENMETFTISNCGSIESVMAICFKNDVNASTFLLEPPEMVLQPGENQTLTVWAYPKTPVEFRDQIVCSIQHNPDPVIFKICCIGVEPELKVDKKLLEFGKVLLHRRESRVLHLRNNTLLPAAWKLSGTEMLGDEFSFSQEQGIVQPKSEFPLNIHFRAAKPVSYNKRAFKIEISDVEQIIGLMHVENIQLQAEGYDVALDISFPKGMNYYIDSNAAIMIARY